MVFGGALAIIPWSVMCARATADHADRTVERDRVLLVASDADRIHLLEELERGHRAPREVVAALDAAQAARTRGRLAAARHAPAPTGASVIVLSRDAQTDETIVAQAALLHESGTRIRTLSLFYEEWLGKLPVSELERVSLHVRHRRGAPQPVPAPEAGVDVAVALPGLLVLASWCPLVLVGQPVRQPRPAPVPPGRGWASGAGPSHPQVPVDAWRGRRGSASAGPTSTTPRITRSAACSGSATSTSCPQVVNILRGDLSIVGPRPEQPRYVDELVVKLPFYGLRHLVRPGLTGWAQVKYRYASDDRDALEKLQYEFFYLRHQGIALDLRIIGRTVRSVLGRGGR